MKTDLLGIGSILIAIGLFVIIIGYIQDLDDNSILSNISPYAWLVVFSVGIILIVGGLILAGNLISKPKEDKKHQVTTKNRMCNGCGNFLPDDANITFCYYCGHKLE
jgi:ribosomal protein S27AE